MLGFAALRAPASSAATCSILGAVALGAIGYAEGAALAREMGGSRVICWALVLSAPITFPVAVVGAPPPASTPA